MSAPIPKRIYLQWYGDGDPADGGPEIIVEDSLTWSHDKIFDADICFVRAGKKSDTEAALQRNNAGWCTQMNAAMDSLRRQAEQIRKLEILWLEALEKQSEYMPISAIRAELEADGIDCDALVARVQELVARQENESIELGIAVRESESRQPLGLNETPETAQERQVSDQGTDKED